jgi:excisionase family DNA binding protein
MEPNPTFEASLRQLLIPIINEAVETAIARHFSVKIATQQPVPQQQAPQQPATDILDVDGAAALLGLKKTYIYKLTHNRRIPYYTTGKRIYFKRDELVGYVTRIRVKTQDEIEQEADNYLARKRRNG